MADAGIVNVDGRQNDGEFLGVVAKSKPEIRALSIAVRDLVYDVLPETIEVVWPTQGSVGWGVGPKKFSEQFCYFMPYAKHVTLGFYYGGDLPDPESLLRGGGRQVGGKLSMRSIKITDPGQLSRPELRTLLEEAVAHVRVAMKST
jgi:hypothetical protein